MTPRPSRTAATVAAVVVVALLGLVAGCGEGTAGEPKGQGSLPPGTTDRAVGDVVMFEASATAMRRLPGDRGLVITVTVPAGAPGCGADAEAAHTADDYGVLHVSTTVAAPATGCPETAERTVTLRVPVRGRDVALNNELWKPGVGDGYVRCSTEVGCHPPADRCAEVWTRSVTRGAELPPEQSVDVLACADGWLVLDVDAVVTGCQGVDGATPPSGCAGSGVHTRWFARLDHDRRWDVVASGTAPGCAPVADIPDFPRAMCEALPRR